jgi:D-alanyl-D-alanine carboxypeptidase/D-alanyl-D-alanine-endopeptidase (penicillin-binding protein 4)
MSSCPVVLPPASHPSPTSGSPLDPSPTGRAAERRFPFRRGCLAGLAVLSLTASCGVPTAAPSDPAPSTQVWSARGVSGLASSAPASRATSSRTTSSPATSSVRKASPKSAARARKVDRALAKRLSSVMSDSRVRRATSSALVLEAGNGAVVYGRYASRPIRPASNTKILTAVAAMNYLGPHYRFTTDVIRRGPITKGVLHGRLYLKGYGDPTSRASDYASLARKVRASGVRVVTGSLVADASFFDSHRYNAGWSREYSSSYYAAQTSALTVAPNADLDSGTVLLTYKPGRRGKPARVSVSPAGAKKYLTIVNRTTTGARGSAATVGANRAFTSNRITVRGRVPLGRGAASQLITVNRPDLYAAAVFRAALTKAGVRVAGGTTALRTPASARHRLARDRSMTLSKLLVPFLKLSNNMHAEALTKTMGAQNGHAGSWTAGIARTSAFAHSLGAPRAGVRLVDGSGLSRADRVSPQALARVLQKVQAKPWFPAFYAALPIAGHPGRMTGGTLRHRMTGTKAARNAHAKTGSLTGVTALSGYVKGADGRRYVFSMLSQYTGASPRPLEDELVVTLARWR